MSGSTDTGDSEETINQYLQENGLLEEDMTLDDKRSLWEVIKLSKDTAHAEEQDRQKRARRNLQFDEVSSRSDGTREEEYPVVADPPQVHSKSCDSSHQNTDTVLPVSHTSVSSSSRAYVAASQPSPPMDSLGRDTSKQVVVPSPRRSLRSKSNESFSVSEDNHQIISVPEGLSNKQNTISRILRKSLSPVTVQKVQSHRQTQNSVNVNTLSPGNDHSPTILESIASPEKEHEYNSELESEHREPSQIKWSDDVAGSSKPDLSSTCSDDHREASPSWSEVVAGSSKTDVPSTVSSMELPHDESPTFSDHESSPVRKMRQGFSIFLNVSQSDENKEECCALSEKEKIEIVPSPDRESPSNEIISKEKERKLENDKERNIDAFNCDRSNYEHSLKVRKPRKMCSRLPFYIPPHKMDVHCYIAYFKKCINDHAAKLLEFQKRCHKCVPWGDPVIVGEMNSDSLDNVVQKNNMSTVQRYNFRDRRVPSKKVDTIYEDSNSQNEIKTQEEEATNDAFFDSLLDDKSSDGVEIIKKEEMTENSRSNAATPERQGSKRKSESGDEMEEKRSATGTWLTAVKSDEEEVAVKRKKMGRVYYAGAKGSADKGSLQLGKRRQRKNSKTSINTETVEEDDTEILEDSSSVSNSHNEGDIIRPGQVKLRRNGRRRVLQTGQQQQNEADVTVVYESSNISNNSTPQEVKVPCPICRVSYPANDIEAHASECNEYCAEDIPDDEQNASPQASPQDCWPQYDGVLEGNTQGTAASKHSYGAT